MKAMIVCVALCAAMGSASVQAQATVGRPAPQFSVADTKGHQVSLSDFKGKYVVLEWVNPLCPFSQKHYDSGNMPATQKYAMGKGAAWLTVRTTGVEGGEPKQVAELTTWMGSKKAEPTAVLVDNYGKLGRAYSARTTPHIYIIDPLGKLIYAGAIDSKPSANPADIATATNYVRQSLDEALAGKPISQPVTKPYGCTVKYASAS